MYRKRSEEEQLCNDFAHGQIPDCPTVATWCCVSMPVITFTMCSYFNTCFSVFEILEAQRGLTKGKTYCWLSCELRLADVLQFLLNYVCFNWFRYYSFKNNVDHLLRRQLPCMMYGSLFSSQSLVSITFKNFQGLAALFACHHSFFLPLWQQKL